MELTGTGIEKLCNELLCHIFLIAVESDSPWSNTPATPWHLAAVCRRWRDTSFQITKLWTQFTIGGGADHRCKLREDVCITNQLAILRCYLKLQRSNNLPIHIDATNNHSPCIKVMVRALAKVTHRWGSLRFHPREGRFSVNDFSQQLYPASHFAALRHLHYHCDFENDRLFSLGPHFDSSSLPSLTSLHLVDWLGETSMDAGPFPWAQLKQIRLSEFKGNQSDILYLLKACPSITHFALSSSRAYVSRFNLEKFKLDSIVLSALVHLEIELGWDGEDGDTPRHAPLLDILGYIRTPNLRRLSWRQRESLLQPELVPYIDRELLPMITRSGCSIRSLDISNCWAFEGEDAISGETTLSTSIPRFFAEVCQGVEDLMLITGSDKREDVYNCDGMLHKMVVDKTNDDLLFPHLKRLQIKDLQLDPILLSHVIQSRKDHIPHKDSVIVSLERVEIAYKNNGLGYDRYKNSMAKYYLDTLNIVREVGSRCQVVIDPQYFLPRFLLNEP